MSLTLDAWGHALDRLERGSHVEQWRADPVAWLRDRLGEDAWSRQAQIMRDVATHPLVTVQSCHGIGKTFLASRLVLWFLDTHPIDQTMVVTTAPTSHQVRAVLWRYIRQGHEKGNLPGLITQSQVPEWKIDGNLVAYGRRPADHQQSAFQGQHAEHMLVVLDEAGGIPKWLWDAADSLMTGPDQHLLAIGNSDNSSSHFYVVCTSEAGWVRHRVSAFDPPAFTGEQVTPEMAARLVTRKWVDDKQRRWGETNPLYKAKVLGEFTDSEDGLIPLSWVRAANARWHEWFEAGAREVGGRRIIGVDVARYGTDSTAIALREGDVIREVKRWTRKDTVETTDLVEHELAFPKSLAVVDVIGVGAGVLDLLRSRRLAAVGFNASQATKRRDRTGMWRFPNARSAAWWNLRKRLGRSTDTGDAVVQAVWHNPSTARDASDDELSRQPRRPRAMAYADSVTWG